MIFSVQHITARDLLPGDIIVRWNADTVLATEVTDVWHNPMRQVYEVGSNTAVLIGSDGIHQYRKGVELYPPRELICIIRNPERCSPGNTCGDHPSDTYCGRTL